MKKLTLFVLSIFLLSAWACQPHETDSKSNHKVHWSYVGEDGPNNWNKICDDFTACGGKHQSPINIVTNAAKEDAHLQPLQLNYKTTFVHILNNGHTVQFNCDKGSSANANGKTYELKQFHFHTPSEHEINGQHYPMEAHFVHQAKDGTLAVVGILFKTGKENHFFAEHLKETPHKEGQFEGKTQFDLHELLPSENSYFYYDGSLTTPPCSEIVSWYVMEVPIEISNEQVAEMHGIMHDNYRPVQPINDRVLAHYSSH